MYRIVRFRHVLRVSPCTFSPIQDASIPPAVCALGCTDLDRLSFAPIATVSDCRVARSSLAHALGPSAAEATANMTKLTSVRLYVGLTLCESCSTRFFRIGGIFGVHCCARRNQ